MRNMYQGIFVKEFLLFYGEKMEYYLTFTNRQGEGKTEVKTVSNDRRTKSRKDAVPASESDESSARGRRFGKSRRSIPKSICSRRLWFGTVLHLWRKKKQQEDTTWNRKI